MATVPCGEDLEKPSVYTHGSASESLTGSILFFSLGTYIWKLGERKELSTLVIKAKFLAPIYVFLILCVDDQHFSRLAIFFIPRTTIII